ncbi:MAG: tetratricopeptide repeat protein [Alphaproteobacteria bacterium]
MPLLLEFLMPDRLAAQQGAVESVPDAARRSQRELEDAAKAAERARIQRLLDSGGEVTYQDVLKDPDNIELNLRFARTQIARENIRGASATLERILLLEPERPDVRLLYAVVLFRLDKIQDAEREFLAVRDLPMEASLKAEIEGFLAQIRQRQKRLRYNALVAFGFQYDWNGNTAPRSNTRLASGFPLQISDADLRHTDISFNGTLQGGFDYDLGYQRRHSLGSTITAYRSEHRRETQLDLEALSWDVGPTLTFEPVNIDPAFTLTEVRLAHQRYLTILRLETETAWQATKKTSLSATTGYEYQHFNSLSVSLTAAERRGRQIDGKIGVAHLLDPTIRLGGHFRYHDKNADRNYHSYHRYEMTAEGTFLLSGGRFLILSYTHQRDIYKEPDTFTSNETRSEWNGRARVLFGFPISNLFEGDWAAALSGLTATMSVERLHAVSNIRDYTYRNNIFAVGLSRKWNF